MMKRLLLCFLSMSVWLPVCFASIVDEPETIDGYLTEGEYLGGGVTVEYEEELYVMKGGGNEIKVRDYGYLEVQSTSTPLGIDVGGIMDIVLYDDSDLLYLGGITDEITVRDDAAAVLKGGTVNGITIYHLPSWESKVTVYCREGYQKTASGISGLWADGASFDIDFINPTGVFSPYPTANYVTVITPEPATLALLAFGGLLLRWKK